MSDITITICEQDIHLIRLILVNAANRWYEAGLESTALRLKEYVSVIDEKDLEVNVP